MAIMKSLSDISIQYAKGVGPARKKIFAHLGVDSIEDLLYFFPRRYEDRTAMTKIAKLKIGEWQTVTGKVLVTGGRQSWFTRKKVFEVLLADESGRLTAVWFNQPYLQQYFQPGRLVVLYGKVDVYKNRVQMVAPEYEIIDGEEKDNLSTGRIVPVYSLTRGITQRSLRKVIRGCLDRFHDELQDFLPVPIRNKYRLANIRRSLENLHFPQSFELQKEAFKRISFEEFFFFQVSVMLRRMSILQKNGISHRIEGDWVEKFFQAFPFPLTAAQKRVIHEITRDMAASSPMLRLLHGEVGSGKTLVALFGCVVAHRNGYQSAVMAPTEILARQHYLSIQQLMAGGPFSSMRLAFLASSLKKREREEILQKLRNGEIDVVVGTHALLSEGVEFKNLTFVVIDEQHKFGVRQRALLSLKGTNPDILIMTATPIPRTLCMTLFGDLDTSTLDELPPGRGKVTTKIFSQEQAPEVYTMIKEMVRRGRQVYCVYPLVEESKKLDLKAAEKMFEYFQKEEFKEFRLGLIHGQMPRKETEPIMEDFKNKKIDILVATTVVEVGVDVPNANVMMIEHAERFGLAQLHQLRGRIGRGKEDAVCLLVADPVTEESRARLEVMLKTNDGFKIAEQDLMLRGPGHYFGRHQHGLNELKVADPASQMDILEIARREAMDLIHEDPSLAQPRHTSIKQIIQKRYPQYLAMVEAG